MPPLLLLLLCVLIVLIVNVAYSMCNLNIVMRYIGQYKMQLHVLNCYYIKRFLYLYGVTRGVNQLFCLQQYKKWYLWVFIN